MNNPTIYIVASALIIYYSWISERLLEAPRTAFEMPPESQSWIRTILRAFKYYFMGVLVILLADLIIFNSSTDLSYFYFQRFYYFPFFIGMALLTYWIGIAGYTRRNQEAAQFKKSLSDDERSRLEQIAQDLQRLMEGQQLYKVQDISINSLAESLEVKPYLVSRSLNEILDQKFNDFINAYRVEEVRRLVNDPANQHFTLLSLAMDAGFNSKSSFQRAVKKHLGIAPSELKKA